MQGCLWVISDYDGNLWAQGWEGSALAPSDTADLLLREMVDTHRIRNVLLRYARGLDRGDWDLVRSCFTADATDDHGDFQGGIENLIQGARALLEPFWGVMHLLGQIYVQVDGDEAASETYVVSFHRRHGAAGDEDTVTGLRYLDRLVREGDDWKIARRVTVQEWNTAISANEWIDGSSFVSGRRDSTDPSYSLGLVGRWR